MHYCTSNEKYTSINFIQIWRKLSEYGRPRFIYSLGYIPGLRDFFCCDFFFEIYFYFVERRTNDKWEHCHYYVMSDWCHYIAYIPCELRLSILLLYYQSYIYWPNGQHFVFMCWGIIFLSCVQLNPDNYSSSLKRSCF